MRCSNNKLIRNERTFGSFAFLVRCASFLPLPAGDFSSDSNKAMGGNISTAFLERVQCASFLPLPTGDFSSDSNKAMEGNISMKIARVPSK